MSRGAKIEDTGRKKSRTGHALYGPGFAIRQGPGRWSDSGAAQEASCGGHPPVSPDRKQRIVATRRPPSSRGAEHVRESLSAVHAVRVRGATRPLLADPRGPDRVDARGGRLSALVRGPVLVDLLGDGSGGGDRAAAVHRISRTVAFPDGTALRAAHPRHYAVRI